MKITVVGAGIVGGAIAHALASRGARVSLVEARGTGRGATRASAGILAPRLEGHIPPLLTLGLHSLSLYDEFIRRVAADARQPLEYERSGTLQVALNPAEAAALCASARLFEVAGVDHALLDAREAARLEPQLSPEVAGALLVPEHGYVSAGALTDALVRAALNLGATLTTARVLGVAGGEVATVRTADERLETDAVIIAAGSWSADLGDAVSASRHPAHGAAPPGNQGPVVKPIRGQLVQLRLGARPASRVIWGSGCYLVPWRDGTVLAGATVEDVGFDESATASGVAQLLGASAGLMPVLREAAFEEVRVGLRPMTADELPAIGRSSSMRNVFYATGHYRNGVLLAPLTARLVADLVLEDREGEDLALVRPDRLGL